MKELVILIIRLYQRALRGVFSRRCIYKLSCSEYAIQLFKAPNRSFWECVRIARWRVAGCGVSSITVARKPAKPRVLDRRGGVIPIDELACHIIERIDKEEARLLNTPVVPLILEQENSIKETDLPN